MQPYLWLHTKFHFTRPSGSIVLLLIRAGGQAGRQLEAIENKANSVQTQLNLPVRTELGNIDSAFQVQCINKLSERAKM